MSGNWAHNPQPNGVNSGAPFSLQFDPEYLTRKGRQVKGGFSTGKQSFMDINDKYKLHSDLEEEKLFQISVVLIGNYTSILPKSEITFNL